MRDLAEVERELRTAIARIRFKDRIILLAVLDAQTGARAQFIGSMYRAGGGSAALPELLMDIEADPQAMAILRPLLRESVLRPQRT